MTHTARSPKLNRGGAAESRSSSSGTLLEAADAGGPTHGDASGSSGARWSHARLLALAASQGAAYFGFGLQYALLTPFVLELGVPTRWSSLIWLGGPVTGMVVQPWIGRLSDQGGATGSKCLDSLVGRFGRRRPFLGVGAICLAFSQVMLANCADLGHLLGDDVDDRFKPWSAAIFTLGFWILDASNNAVWVVSKSLTADVVPREQWPIAFSLATAATGLGLALGYVAGGVNWSAWSSFGIFNSKACNTEGGCADLRVAFLFAFVSCLAMNCCTLCVGVEEPCQRRTGQPSASRPQSSLSAPFRVSGSNTPTIAAPREATRNLRDVDMRLSRPSAFQVLLQDPVLLGTYTVTMLAWLGWISVQVYQTEFVALEVFKGSSDPSSALNQQYVDGVQSASRALIINALLMTAVTYVIPAVLRAVGERALWASSIALTAMLLAASIPIRCFHAKTASSIWLALLGPMYGVQQTIPFVLVSSRAPKELLGELNGYLNVVLCIPQLMVALFGGSIISLVNSDCILFGAGALVDVVAVVVCLWTLRSLRQETSPPLEFIEATTV